MNEETKKTVDESWKDQIEKEKQQKAKTEQKFHQPSFTIFISSLSMQAMIAMGSLENPVTKKKEANPEQARFLIDTLDIIKQKTEGNLTKEESHFLEESLYHLRMGYIETQNAKKG